MKKFSLAGSQLVSKELIESAVAFAEEISSSDFEDLVKMTESIAMILVGQDKNESNRLLYFIRLSLVEPRIRQKFMAALRTADRKAYVLSRKFL